jgi:hypothetical protein
VQISNITSLNAPGLATLTTSQVGTPLVIDSNNNIKGLQSTYIWYKRNITSQGSPLSQVILYFRPGATPGVPFGGVFSYVSGTQLSANVSSFFNYTNCIVTSSNWKPIWGTTEATSGFLYFPYTGVYIINWSFGFGNLDAGDSFNGNNYTNSANINYFASICKNYSLASPNNPDSDPSQLACESSSPNTITGNTISATITIENAGVGGDYIVLAIHNSSPSLGINAMNLKGPLFIAKIG